MPQVEITARDAVTARDQQSLRTRPRWHLYVVLGVLHLALTGAIAVLVVSLNGRHPTTDIVAVPPQVEHSSQVATGDELLIAGKWDLAMKAYTLAANDPAIPTTTLAYRLGLCAEQLSQLDEARAHFATAARHDSTAISLSALLGLARVDHRRGLNDESVKTLSQIAAKSALPEYQTSGIVPEVNYLLAFVASARPLSTASQSIRDANHIFTPEPPVLMHHLLQLVNSEGKQLVLPSAGDADTNIGLEVHGPAQEPATTLLSAEFRNQQLSVLLESLSARTSWNISPSRAAGEVAAAKRVDVVLRDQTAAEMLSLVLEPLGLFWTFQGNTLLIDRVENYSREVREARQRDRANSLLQNALGEFPNHLLAPYAFLALGNLAFLDSRFDRAVTFYQEINERFPSHEVRQTANYNLAKVWFIQKDFKQAAECFYNVIDLRRGSGLDAVSRLHLGRIFMDEGDLQQAKKTLSRGLATATEQDVSATLSLTLAAAYLMAEEAGAAESANAVLMENREALTSKAYLSKAIFLSALTRYYAAFRPSELRRRKRELMAAVMKVDPADFFGEFGYLLVGDALTEVGVPLEALRMYTLGLCRPISPSMRDRLLYRLATEYRKQNNHLLAQNSLLELAAGRSATWAPIASIELAALLQQQGEWNECISHCRWALAEGYAERHNASILSILGHVYEELGDHERAAHCFAGFLPSDDLKIAEAPR